jgi:cytochrome P450
MSKELDPQEYGRWETPRELTSREGALYPFGFYETKRKNNPVSYDEERGVWDVFRWEDVKRVASDYEHFSSEGAGIFDQTYDDEDEDVSPVIVSADPPEHTRLRNLVNDHFYPEQLQQYQPEMEQRAEQLMDQALADGPEFDFATEVAWKFPMIIIADMLGVPQEKRDTYKQWSDILVGTPTEMETASREEMMQKRVTALQEMAGFFGRMIETRKNEDRNDLMATLLRSDLTDKEIIKFGQILILAGNITTTMFLSNAIWTFIEEDLIPDLKDGTVELDRALDEVLRYRSPVKEVTRKTAQEVEIGEETIPEGEIVWGWLGSANRDEEVFEHPSEFNPSRPTRKHLAFGDGPHTCLGSNLAKFEASILLQEFLDRVDDATLATDRLDPFYSRATYGVESLPIRVEPTQ